MKRTNRVAVGNTIATLFCPAPNGKLFGVTIDKDDLPRVLAAGFWKVRNLSSARGGVSLYCYLEGRDGPFLHRFLLNAAPGQPVDHRHHRTLDNRKAEIRLTTHGLNGLNRLLPSAQPNQTGYRGVIVRGNGRFSARVRLHGKAHHLGTFDTPAEAGAIVNEFLTAAVNA